MKYILIFIGLAIVMNNNREINKEIFCVKENSKLITSLMDSTMNNNYFPTYKIVDDSLSSVFIYKKQVNNNEISETEFIFEVKNTNIDDFAFHNEEIRKVNALYTYKDGNVFLVDSINFRLNKGYIKGSRLSPLMWKVSIKVEVRDNDSNKSFEFVLDEIYNSCNMQ